MNEVDKRINKEIIKRHNKKVKLSSSGSAGVSLQNEDKFKAVKEWQDDKNVHPLTCGKCSEHKKLIAVGALGIGIILVCPDYLCDYEQLTIPKIVYQKYINAHFAG